MNIRVGFGFDVHRLVEGRELWLGGIRLEHEKGLLGHSDADVLIHGQGGGVDARGVAVEIAERYDAFVAFGDVVERFAELAA